LNGCLYFTRIALAYLKQKDPETPGTNGPGQFSKSLTLISSAAAFQEAPGVCAYSASKAGILGLVRSLKAISPVRVNSICPWATDTKMIAGHAHLFRDAGLPLQTADDVAATVLQAATNPKLHGAAVFVGGGKNIDVEQGFSATESQWLGTYIQDLMAKQAEAFEAQVC
jgi:NAD(P)-dependent dehydrogenase (short-subunit alcohol dehydrogenase family)